MPSVRDEQKWAAVSFVDIRALEESSLGAASSDIKCASAVTFVKTVPDYAEVSPQSRSVSEFPDSPMTARNYTIWGIR